MTETADDPMFNTTKSIIKTQSQITEHMAKPNGHRSRMLFRLGMDGLLKTKSFCSFMETALLEYTEACRLVSYHQYMNSSGNTVAILLQLKELTHIYHIFSVLYID